jgi:hypothetical protein
MTIGNSHSFPLLQTLGAIIAISMTIPTRVPEVDASGCNGDRPSSFGHPMATSWIPTMETISPMTSGGNSILSFRMNRDSTSVKVPLIAVIPNNKGKPPIRPARIVGARYVRLQDAGQRYPDPSQPRRAWRIVVIPEAIVDNRSTLCACTLLAPIASAATIT